MEKTRRFNTDVAPPHDLMTCDLMIVRIESASIMRWRNVFWGVAGAVYVCELGRLVAVGDASRGLLPPVVARDAEGLDGRGVGVEVLQRQHRKGTISH